MAMDPYYEQRLRDEVIYLHSLWHQGPPRPNPNPNLNHHPSTHLPPSSNPIQFKKRNSNHNPSSTHLPPSSNPTQFKKRSTNRNPSSTHLPPSTNPTQFKKQNTRDKSRGKRGKKNPPQPDPPPPSTVEWPCPVSAAASSSWGWPKPNPAPSPPTRLPSAEEQAQFVQRKALNAAQGFFSANLDSDGEADCGSDDEDELVDEDGYEEYQFFLKVFMEDGELRGYHEKNWEGGDFCCLVCGGIGKRKKFKNCVALVQHSVTVAKTKKKRAHRAYGQVLCRVLGWDIDRLPSIVSSLDRALGRSLEKPVESQGNAEVCIGESSMINKDLGLENVCNGDSVLKEVSDVGKEEDMQNSSVPGTSNVISENVMLCENPLKAGDANICSENNNSSGNNGIYGECISNEISDVGQDEALQNSSVPGTSNVISENVILCENHLKAGDANKCIENYNSSGVSSSVDGNTEGVVNCLDHRNEINNEMAIVVVNDPKENNGNQN